MKKFIGAVFTLVVSCSFFFCQSKESSVDNANEPAGQSQVTNELPAMSLTMSDGSVVNAKDLTGKTVLILFQPDCDHCQREAALIRSRVEAFEKYTLYFVSSDSLNLIEEFAVNFDLKNYKNVHFAQTTTESILSNFGPISAPSIYIYNENGKRTRSFNGETSIEEVIKSL